MPIVASPAQQAWIRVPPPRRKLDRTHANNALKGPLAYFSCQPVPSKPPTKIPPCPQYDLDDDLELLPTKKRNGHTAGAKSKDRTVSAPAIPGNGERRRRGGGPHHDHSHNHDAEEDDGVYSDHEEHSHNYSHRERRSPPSLERSRPHHSSRPTHPHSPTTSTTNYWTGPTKTPRSYTSSHTGSSGSGSSRSTVSARWANATAPLDLG